MLASPAARRVLAVVCLYAVLLCALFAMARAQALPRRQDAASCLSPRTGLDICRLRKGDILLEASNITQIRLIPFMPSRDLLSQVGTYWFHIAIYDGRGKVLEARGPDSAHPAEEVRSTPIQQTSFYGTGQGTDAIDWVVLRLKPRYRHAIDGAVAWATERANNPRVRFMGEDSWQELLTFLNPWNKAQDMRFYCSLYVWRAFQRQGLDLDYHGPLPVSPAMLVTRGQVRPDDIYASALGPYAVADVVMDKQSGWQRALTVLTNYELISTYLEAWLYRPISWLVALAGVAVLYRLYRRRRRARVGQALPEVHEGWPEQSQELGGRLDVAR